MQSVPRLGLASNLLRLHLQRHSRHHEFNIRLPLEQGFPLSSTYLGRHDFTETMKSSTALLPLALSCFATASIFGDSQKVLDSELAVPGDNPLEYCAETDDYTLTISKVDLNPNPPLPYAQPPNACQLWESKR